MTARSLGEVENAAFDQVIVETKRGTRGRYWTYIRTGLIVVSDDALTGDHPRAVIVPLTPDWSIRIATAQRLRRVWRGQSPRALFTLQRRKRIGHALRRAMRTGLLLTDVLQGHPAAPGREHRYLQQFLGLDEGHNRTMTCSVTLR